MNDVIVCQKQYDHAMHKSLFVSPNLEPYFILLFIIYTLNVLRIRDTEL